MTKLERLQLAKSYFPDATPELEFESGWQLIIAVMLSAQTTDKAVNKVTRDLFKQYPTARSLSQASYDDVREIIKRIGLANTKAKNTIAICKYYCNELNEQVPNDRPALMAMPGVGQKTANVVLAILYDAPYMAVDTHVHRICKRLKIIPENRDVKYAEKTLERILKGENINQYHQSLIYFGRYHCKAQNPNCENCNLTGECRYYRQNNK